MVYLLIFMFMLTIMLYSRDSKGKINFHTDVLKMISEEKSIVKKAYLFLFMIAGSIGLYISYVLIGALSFFVHPIEY